jgi:hypothetical protein
LGQLGDICAVSWTNSSEIVDTTGSIIGGLQFNDGFVYVIEYHSVDGNVIYYDFVNHVPDVTITLDGDASETTLTDPSGSFNIDSLIAGDFTICPSKTDDDPGVTVTDAVNIRRHIVHLEEFDSPYKYIAADVNNSSNISVADVVKIRRYLAVIDSLPSGNWAFVDSSFEISFQNWSYAPTCIDFSIWDIDLFDQSFVAVRMGDVDNSWPLGLITNHSIVNDDSVSLTLDNVEGYVGETVVMDLTVDGFTDVAGVELHVLYPPDQITYVNISSEVMPNPTINMIDDQIHFVWEDINNPLNLPDGQVAVSIEFEIGEGAPDSFNISFNRIFVVDIEGEDLTILSQDGIITRLLTSLDDDEEIPISFDLGPNYPNPFNSSTIINYQLPQSSHVQIVIYDVLGRTIDTILDETKEAGFHQVTWNSPNQTSGIYFYRMITDEFNKTSKMLYLK